MKRLLASYLSVFLLLSIIGLSACEKSAPVNIDFCYGIGYVEAEPEALAFLESKLDEILPVMVNHAGKSDQNSKDPVVVTPPFCVETVPAEEQSETPIYTFTVFYQSKIIGTIFVSLYDGAYQYSFSPDHLVKELSQLTKDNRNRTAVSFAKTDGTAPTVEIRDAPEGDVHTNEDNVLFLYYLNETGA